MKHVVGPTYVARTVLNLLFSVMHSPSALVRRLHINRFAASASAVGKQLFHHIAAEHLPLASNALLFRLSTPVFVMSQNYCCPVATQPDLRRVDLLPMV